MKIGLFFWLLLYLFTSCQNSYSEETIEQHLRLNEQFERSNILIKKNTAKVIDNTHTKIQRMPHYRILGLKLKEVTQFVDSLYQEVDDFKTQLKDIPQEQQVFNTFEILSKKIQKFDQHLIQFVENCWDNGGIKATIFADISKKQTTLQRLKEELKPLAFQQLNFNTFNNKNQPLAFTLTQLNILQNDIRRQENSLVCFFAAQIKSYCGYDCFDVYAFSKKPCIRLGESYEAGICFGNYAPISLLKVTVDKDSLPIVNNKANYQKSSTQLGEQAYKTAVTFQHLISEEVEYREQLFYFEVSAQ
jgi:hypothetical protein